MGLFGAVSTNSELLQWLLIFGGLLHKGSDHRRSNAVHTRPYRNYFFHFLISQVHPESAVQSLQKTRMAFTLVETLVVVTIVVALLAVSSPALMRTLQATKLASAGESLMGAISEAQQVATSQNVPVELRFFSRVGDFGGVELFREYQLFKAVVETQGAGAQAEVRESIVPIGGMVSLPEGIVIAADKELSPLIAGAGFQDNKDQNIRYNGIQFMPDGSCRKVGATVTSGGATLAALSFPSLPESYVTLTYDISAEITVQTLPKNFYTIQIDPFTSKARSFKPGF